jgi:23S rRNA pseudouridine2457 synthase
MKSFHYILFYKPYGVLSQFTSESRWQTLRDFGPFPPTVYPVGRLDAESEGLLLLTDDNEVNHRLASPKYEHPKTYLVQVEHSPDENALSRLRNGFVIEKKKTKPAEVRVLSEEPTLPTRPVPVRFRKTISTSWLELTLQEGRNRQVRKMTAAVGCPTLRLVRTKIGFLTIQGLLPGNSRDLLSDEILGLQISLGLSKAKPSILSK